MTYGSAHNRSNPRREKAREKSRMLREQHKKVEKRNRNLVRGIIAFGTIAILGAVAMLILSSNRDPSPGPLNMRSDGIVIGEGLRAVETGAVPPGREPIPTVHDGDAEVIIIDLYVDYFNPLSAAFQEANGKQIAIWVESGAATIEVHPLAILDRVSEGTRYSSRSANAAACVANFAPNQYFAFHGLLLENLPEENSGGLTDDELVALTVESKVDNATKIRGCVQDDTFIAWVADARDRALRNSIQNTDLPPISSTPTIIVNGLPYDGAMNDPAAFSAFVVSAAGRSFNENSTPSPSPTPSVTPVN